MVVTEKEKIGTAIAFLVMCSIYELYENEDEKERMKKKEVELRKRYEEIE